MHDKYGNPVQEGDRVALLATIKSVTAGAEYCNATVTPEENMPPYDNPNVSATVNTKQLVKLTEPLPFEVVGREWRDKVTGAVGTATEMVYQSTRVPRVMLEGKDSTGRPFEWWYDLNRLEPVA